VLPWLSVVIALCVIAVTIALVLTLLALKRAAERAERVLAIVEGDLHPTLERAQALIDELRGLGEDLRLEVERLGVLTRRTSEFAQGAGRLMMGLAGFTKAGQIMGIAAGVKTGLDVFLRRVRRR
jgi:uncharacterized protein YoxC